MVKEDEYLLTNQEILGGLRTALERGQTLKQAMMSFYQAGYKKEEIEDAARAYLYLQKGNSELQTLNKNQGVEKKKIEPSKEEAKKPLFGKKDDEKKYSEVQKTKVPVIGGDEKGKQPEKKNVQKISGYEGKKDLSNLKSKTVTSVLVITLIVLVGILALVFLFKNELVNFINGLFG